MNGLTGRRVLHIVEPWAAGPRPWFQRSTGSDALTVACAMICASEPAHHAILLGPARAERRAGTIGLRTTDSACPPARRPELSWRSVRRLLRAAGPCEALVLWGDRVARLVPAVAGLAPRVLRASIRNEPRAAMSADPHDGGPRASAMGDVDAQRWRRARGLTGEDVVVALLDEPAHAPNARRFLFLLGKLEVTGRRVIGLVPSGASEGPRARRFRRAVGLKTRLFEADRPMSALMEVCDIGLLLGPFDDTTRPEGTSERVARFNLLLAHRAGLPVVTAEQPAITDGVPEEARSCLACSHHSADLGRTLFELVEDPARRATVRARLLESAAASPNPLSLVRFSPARSAIQGDEHVD